MKMIRENDHVTVKSPVGTTILDHAIVVNVPFKPSEMWIFMDAETKNTIGATDVVVERRDNETN